MPLILPSARRNPLEFPFGVLPGYDPAHIGAAGTQFSAVPRSRSFTNILTGANGAPGTNNVAGINSAGMFTTIVGATGVANFATGFSKVNSPTATFAFIGSFNSTVGNAIMMQGDGAGTGGNGFCVRGINRQHQIAIKPSFTSITTTVTQPIGVLYFFVVSVGPTVSNWASVRLDTGAIISGSGAGLTSTAPNGGCAIGISGAGFAPDFNFAAAMWAQGFLSKQACLMWAADPWSFWYPDPGDNFVGVYGAAPPATTGMGALLSDTRSMIVGGGLIL